MHSHILQRANAALPQLLFALCSAACAEPPSVMEARSATHNAEATRIGFWNVRKLGQDAHKDMRALCALIAEHFDVIGIAEVMAEDLTGDVAALRACLTPEFALLETSEARPRGAQPYREHSWLFLRPAHALPCPETRELRHAEPPAFAEDAAFLRPPSFACLAFSDGTRALVGVYHARWGTGEPAMVAREVAQLDDTLAAAPRALSGPEDVFLLGDLNLTPEAAALATGLRIHTVGEGSTLSPTGAITDHLYDQLLIGPSTALTLGDAHVLDLREAAGGPLAFHRTLSDHLPIVALLGRAGSSAGARGPSPLRVPYPGPSE